MIALLAAGHLLLAASSLPVADSSQPLADSSQRPPANGFPWYGSLGLESADTLFAVSKLQRRNIQYHTMGEVLARGTVFQPLSQGGFGQHDAISVAGSTNSNLGVSMNGRPMNSTYSGQYLLSLAAPEGVDRTEILTGSAAVGLSPILTQTAINNVEVRFNTATPYLALWYSQGGGETVAADVALAQNIAPGLNMNVGVRRIGSDGRYLQTFWDAWNVRVNTRYAADSLTTLSLSYNLTSHNTDLWGGIRTKLDPNTLTERTTPTVFDDLRDHTRRHDVTLGGERLFTSDSAYAINVQAYYTWDEMLRIRDASLTTYTADTSRYIHYLGQQAGLIVRTRHRFGSTLLRMGAAVDYQSNDAAPYTQATSLAQPRVFAMFNAPERGDFSVQASAHLASEHGVGVFGTGLGILWRFGPGQVRADLSLAERAPSLAEAAQSIQGTQLSKERTLLGLLEARYTISPQFHALGQLFVRSTQNAIQGVAVTDSNQRVYLVNSTNSENPVLLGGFVVSASYHLDFLDIQATARGHALDVDQSPLPPFSADLTANYVYRIGANSVRIGGKVSVVAPMTSQQFVPLSWQYVQPTGGTQGWVYNGLDVFLQATLGNASVRLSYENILAARWYTTALAPVIIRDLRLSVTWSFIE
jgi:hypothetical protein